MKRIVDIFAACSGLLIFSPLLLVVSMIVFWRLGAPVFFVQVRPGRFGKPFKIFKFRTMLNALDEKGCPLPDSQRLTRLGRFLRSSSIDELPELWNVLKGDMSLVGPRPLLMEYLTKYTKRQARRHEVRPGITGWAQVNGRNALKWEDKFELDVWYVENGNIVLDFKILWLTFKKVIKKEGINASGEATMPKFTGRNE